MKKQLTFLFLLLFFLIPLNTKAASISVKPATTEVTIGGNLTVKVTINEPQGLGAWEFSLNYDSDKLTLLSGKAHVVDNVDYAGEKSRTYAYTFRAKSKGDAKINIINSQIADWNDNSTYPTTSTTVKIVDKETITKNYSTNNYLKSLEIEGYEVNFNKDTTTYTLEVENDVKTLNIKATTEDNKARLTGIGKIEVHEGSNIHEVKVTSESGAVKTYTINITVKEKNPITVKINKEDYTVVRDKEELKDYLKSYYKETTIKINDEEVTVYKITPLHITLVPLKDKTGKVVFYQYKNKKYQKYEEIATSNLAIHLLKPKKVPKYYQKCHITINKTTYEAYKLKKATHVLIYGENVETATKDFYVYDTKEKTLQRYYKTGINLYNQKLKMNSYLILVLISLLIIILITFLIALHSKRRVYNKKEVKKRLKQEKEEFLK